MSDDQVIVFESDKEMFDHIDQIRQEAEANNDPVHLADILGEDQEGGWWVNVQTAYEYKDLNLVIFCRVIGKTEFMAQAESVYTDGDVLGLDYYIDYYAGRWEDQLKTGFLLTESFSAICPQGEFGDVHTSRLAFPIGGTALETIRKDGWIILDANGGLTDGGLFVRALAEEFDA
jgi:hypothetical protein